MKGEAPIIHRIRTYISASFCVSITAAMGIPKLETGPQKSRERHRLSAICTIYLHFIALESTSSRAESVFLPSSMSLSVLSRRWATSGRQSLQEKLGSIIRTGWADIVQHRVGADLRVNRLDSSRHCEIAVSYHTGSWIRGKKRRYLEDGKADSPAAAVGDVTWSTLHCHRRWNWCIIDKFEF